MMKYMKIQTLFNKIQKYWVYHYSVQIGLCRRQPFIVK